MTTLEWPIKFMCSTTATVYVLSLITANVSQVDRVWTFLPTIYIAYFALLPLWPSVAPGLLPLFPYVPNDIDARVVGDYSPRALMMLVLAVVWMFRLSYNTWRRGLFGLSEEDYRWAILRQRIPGWLFHVTNFFFIAIIQNIILFLLSVPTHTAIHQPHTPPTVTDCTLFALALFVLAMEFTADNQQYSYQTFKHSAGQEKTASEKAKAMGDWIGARISWTEDDRKRGFVTKGLWAWSRHPNFLCEQSFWIIMSLFPYLSSPTPGSPQPPSLLALPYLSSLPSLLAPISNHRYMHAFLTRYAPRLSALAPYAPVASALAPALVLCTLFFSSTLFTESISLGKYPAAYTAYKQRVGMFSPLKAVLWHLLGGGGVGDRLVWGGEAKSE